MLQIATWAVVVETILSTFGVILSIGDERKPITRGHAAFVVAFNIFLIAILLVYMGVVR